jgi:signal transduction histidine kinase
LIRISLQHRLTVLIGLTAAAAVAVVVYLGISAVDQTEDTARREQLSSTAQAVAGHVDDVLTRTRGREEHLARMVANAWGQGEPQLTNLLDAYPRLLFESDLYLLRPRGELVWSMRPGVSIPGGLSAEPLVTESIESLQSTVGSCAVSTTRDRSRACFASPVLLEDDEPAGVLLAQIDLGRPDLNLFSLEQLNQTYRIELVAADGTVLAGNEPGEGETSAHTDAVATLSAQGRSGDAVHRQPADDGEGSHTFGYEPVSTVQGWGVIVEPREGAAPAVAGGARQRLLLFGLAAISVSLAIAWLGARQLLKPLRAVTARGAQVAAGDLSTPVVAARRDEIGDLARVLETLRINLKAAVVDAQEVDDARRVSATRGRLLDGLFARQEEERRRIAYELHEGTLQSLAGLALVLDSLKDELDSAGHATRDRVARVRTLALALIDDLRRLAADLRPSVLDNLGLAAAVQSYADSSLSEKGVQIFFHASGLETRPSPHLEASLYRVAQEAIDNMAAHAQAKTATIRLESDGRDISLVVQDDGEGFDAAELLADPHAVRGLGILSMRERIAHLGGTFTIESAPGQGTRVRAEVPLEGEGDKRS